VKNSLPKILDMKRSLLIVYVLVAFVLGVLVGQFFLDQNIASESHLEVKESASRSSANPNEVKPVGAVPGETRVVGRGAPRGGKIGKRTLVEDRVRIMNEYPNAIQFSGFTRSLKVSPECKEILGLEEAEIQEVEELLSTSMKRIEELQVENLKLLEERENVTIFEFPVLEQGADAKLEFEEGLRSILGVDRGGIFLRQSSHQIAQEFSGFGSQRTLIEIERVDERNFKITERFFSKEGREIGSTMTPSTHRVPARYRSILQIEK